MKVRVEVYKDEKGEFRVRYIKSGRVVADGGEGYKTQAKAIRTATRLFESEPAFFVPSEKDPDKFVAWKNG